MTAIYGLLGDFDQEDLRGLGGRLLHRGQKALEWSPADRVWLGVRGTLYGKPGRAAGEASCAVDGTVYNRDELAQRMGISAEATDAELLSLLLEREGPYGLSAVNGDYAMAAWEDSLGRLLLARSPLGVRVLYLWEGKAGLAFASEYKAFFALDGFRPDVDREALQYLQASKYLPGASTLLLGVTRIPAGVALLCTGQGVASQRFWTVETNPQAARTSAAADELRTLFLDSVRRRSQGLEVLGAELSGGIDSAAVVAALREIHPDRPLRTFTIGSGPEDPEVTSSRLVAEHFGADHTEVIFRPDELEALLPRVIWHLEDPVGRTESVLYYRLMMEASQHIRVVLGGYASDGLYAGMPKHKLLRLVEWLPIVDTGLEEFYHYSQTSRQPASVIGRALHRLYYGRSELPMPRVIGGSLERAPVHLKREKAGLLNRMLQDGATHGVPGWMPKVEKTHRALGVEVRSPFTDPELVAHSFRLPAGLKMRGLNDKYILRRAFGDLVPDEIARRPKFPQSMDYDLALSRMLDGMADKYLREADVRRRGLLRAEDVLGLRRRLPGEPYTASRAMRLWTAIATEIWARIYLDSEGQLPGTFVAEDSEAVAESVL